MSNVKKLREGTVFKNWREVCKFFGWKVNGGAYKIKRLNYLKSICDFKKKGNKIIIEKLNKNVELSLKDNRIKNLGKKSLYYNDFEIIMIKLLSEIQEENYLECTITQLMVIAGFVNEDYRKNRFNMSNLIENMRKNLNRNITKREIEFFYEKHQKLFSSNVKNCLKRMENLCLIKLQEIIMVRKNEFNDIGKIIGYYDVKASDDEIEKILEIKKELLKKYNTTTEQKIFNMGLQKPFYKELKQLLTERLGIQIEYKSYKINLNRKGINEEYNKIINAVNIDTLSNNINKKSYNKSISKYNYSIESNLINYNYLNKSNVTLNYKDNLDTLSRTLICNNH